MGDRATVIFFDDQILSPMVYLHWHGRVVPELLQLLRVRMTGRTGDASYAAARFVGICHERIEGNLSLGIQSNHFTRSVLKHRPTLESVSPGNAGLVIVDTRDFTWRAYGGYLASGNRRES
jgi:hypothetical protein